LPALLLAFYGVDGFSIEGDGEPGLGWVCTSEILERCRCEAITELIGEALARVDGGGVDRKLGLETDHSDTCAKRKYKDDGE
jgi:hypothetical protein